MKPLLVSALLLAFLTAATASAAPPKFEVLETRGSAYDRGLQHGQHFRKEIQDDFTKPGGAGWSVAISNRRPEVLRHFLLKLQQLPQHQELIDEMQGIADGSGIPFLDILAYNLTNGLGDRRACSMILIPGNEEEGPVLVNTLDDYTSGKFQRNYPLFVQVAYPTQGHAMVFTCLFASVGANQGLNEAGLATGGTSGGIGPPRGGFNYDGVFYMLLVRYALQFQTRAADAIELFRANRQIEKAVNLGFLDETGAGAVIEFASMAVGVRDIVNAQPVCATNHFESSAFPAYSEAIEREVYQMNSRARMARLRAWTARPDFKLPGVGQRILCDADDGKEGPICQDNKVMYTVLGVALHCRTREALIYIAHPTISEPLKISLASVFKPATGTAAPASPEVQKVLNAQPVKIVTQHVRFDKAVITAVRSAGSELSFTQDGKEYTAELSGSQVALFAVVPLAQIPTNDVFISMTGSTSADKTTFTVARMFSFVPPLPWRSNGRVVNGEAGGALRPNGDQFNLEYETGKTVALTIPPAAQIMLAYRGNPTHVQPVAHAEIFGYTLFEGDTVHATWVNMFVDAAAGQTLSAKGIAGMVYQPPTNAAAPPTHP